MRTTGDGKLSSATRLPVLGVVLLYFGERFVEQTLKSPRKAQILSQGTVPIQHGLWTSPTLSCPGSTAAMTLISCGGLVRVGGKAGLQDVTPHPSPYRE